MGSGCGSVGRAVASYTRGPRFNSSHRRNFIHIFIINCIEKTEKREADNGPFFNSDKRWSLQIVANSLNKQKAVFGALKGIVKEFFDLIR